MTDQRADDEIGAALSDAELSDLRTYVSNATIGPWRSTGHVLDPVYHANIWTADGAIGGTDMAADADFIAVARTAVPALLGEVERLRSALEEIQRNAEPLAQGGPTVGPAAWYFQVINSICLAALAARQAADDDATGEG